MIAARVAHQDAAPSRDLIGTLLLTGIEWTDAHPWFGIVGAAVMIVIGGVLEQVMP